MCDLTEQPHSGVRGQWHWVLHVWELSVSDLLIYLLAFQGSGWAGQPCVSLVDYLYQSRLMVAVNPILSCPMSCMYWVYPIPSHWSYLASHLPCPPPHPPPHPILLFVPFMLFCALVLTLSPSHSNLLPAIISLLYVLTYPVTVTLHAVLFTSVPLHPFLRSHSHPSHISCLSYYV